PGGIFESAFSYYGQQPFYRMPPDQSGAAQAGGLAMPRPPSEAQILAATLVADEAHAPATRTAATNADAVSRHTPALVAAQAGAAALEDGWGLAANAPPDLVRPDAGSDPTLMLAAAPELVARVAAPALFGMAPSAGQIAVGTVPFDG